MHWLSLCQSYFSVYLRIYRLFPLPFYVKNSHTTKHFCITRLIPTIQNPLTSATICKYHFISQPAHCNICCMRHSSRRGNEHTVALPETGPSTANAVVYEWTAKQLFAKEPQATQIRRMRMSRPRRPDAYSRYCSARGVNINQLTPTARSILERKKSSQSISNERTPRERCAFPRSRQSPR